MVTSRYPRPQYPLAPRALAEVLQLQLPAKYQPARGKRWKLADLDQRAWRRLGPEACRELAQHIVRAVDRAIRSGRLPAHQRLPALPRGMGLDELQLEVRTRRCLVAAGIADQPQRLRQMTIGQLLQLRGFGAKSLVDLLTSLEHARAEPATVAVSSAPTAGASPRPRYPRPGEILAPQTLREVLAVRIPGRLVRGSMFQGRPLYDLDERVWNELDEEQIERLARLVVARAARVPHCPNILQRRLPRMPKGMRLEDLHLENRTYNCLVRAGLAARPARLARLTVGQLLAVPSFGSKCLVDLLSAWETRLVRGGKLDRRLSAAARAVLALPQTAEVPADDPRLGPTLQAIDPEARNLREAAERLLARRLDPPEPNEVRRHLRRLQRMLPRLARLPLEEELCEIVCRASSPRDCRIVMEYYGWSGRGGRTLNEVGRKYGLSRERVRQICARVARRCSKSRVFAPVLDRALALLAECDPAPVSVLEEKLAAAGLVRRKLSIASIEQAAELLSRRFPFALVEVRGGHVAVARSRAHLVGPIAQGAAQLVTNFGIASLRQLRAALPPRVRQQSDLRLIRAVLDASGRWCWLDARHTWFRSVRLPRYGLAGMIRKVLSVAGRIEAARLRTALARNRRAAGRVPPAGVLLAFCRQMAGVNVEGRYVCARRPKAWRRALTNVERKIVEVLERHGPVLERGTLEEHCLRRKVNRFSFNAALMSSPVIVQHGRSVYGLVGARVDRRTVRRLTVPRRPGGTRRVLQGCGVTPQGHMWVAYRLSKAAIAGGVVTVPAALKGRLRGRFALRLAGRRKRGTLVVRGGCAWGVGPGLRALGAKEGDYLLITFDKQRHEARLKLGDRSLFEALAREAESAGHTRAKR